MITQLGSIVDGLLGLWPTVCHGFSSEYFSVSRAVNQDAQQWLLFHYDYVDEVGSSTYPGLAVPVGKLLQALVAVPDVPVHGKIQVPLAGIPVERQRRGYLSDPCIPSIGRTLEISAILDQEDSVIACVVEGTRFERGVPSYPLPLDHNLRKSLDTRASENLVIDLQTLAAAEVPIDPWRAYISQ